MDKNIMSEFNLGIVDSLKDKAKKIGHFLFGSMEVPLSASDHYNKSHFEPTDGEAYQTELPFETPQERLSRSIENHRQEIGELVRQAKEARG